MNQGFPSPGVGLAAPNDPRLISRLAQPQNQASYINNKPPQMTISRLVPNTTTAAATITTLTSTTATKSFNQAGGGARWSSTSPSFSSTTKSPSTTHQQISTNSYSNSTKNIKTAALNKDDNSEVPTNDLKAATISTTTTTTTTTTTIINNTTLNTTNSTQSSQTASNIANNNTSISNSSANMKRGLQLKIKSRPKKNQTLNSPVTTRPNSDQTTTTNGSQSQQTTETKPVPPQPIIKSDKDTQVDPMAANHVSSTMRSTSQVASPKILKAEPATRPSMGVDSVLARPTPLANVVRHLPAFQSISSASRSPTPLIIARATKEMTAPQTSASATTTTTATAAPVSSNTTPSSTISSTASQNNNKNDPTKPVVYLTPVGQRVLVAARSLPRTTPTKKESQAPGQQQKTPSQQPVTPTPTPTPPQPQSTSQSSIPSAFSWETYLKLSPAKVAPREAFRQDTGVLVNKFKLGMKLEAKDPRNSSSWCLATVQLMEGPRLRLRFDGGDSMNDFFELINSENIRPVDVRPPDDPLLPPMAFKGNLSLYPKFVEKQLMKADTVVAPRDCFVPAPKKPARNLFQVGMKLEAIDKKNPYLICPATVGEATGDDVKILFDGWKGSFDYVCKYYSRDLFPVNWCRENNHYIAAPNGWEGLLSNSPQKSGKQAPRLDRLSPVQASLKTYARPNAQSRTPSKEAHLAKVQLQPAKNTPIASSPKTPLTQATFSSPPKPNQAAKVSQSTPKTIREGKRKCSASPEPFAVVETRSQPIIELGDSVEEQPTATPINYGRSEPQFQCQRTVPYDEWKKVHKLTRIQSTSGEPSISAGSTPPTSTDDRSVSNLSSTLDEQCPSVNNSDSTSATSVVVEAPAPSVERRTPRGRPPKRMRMEPETEQLFSSLPPGAYTSWTVEQVLSVIKSHETLAKYLNIFENHEIDGKAFGLLTTDIMIKHMGLKIGPVLKIAELIEKVKRLRRHG